MLRSIGRLTSRNAGINASTSVSTLSPRFLATSVPASGSGIYEPEYAFEMASSSIRFGRGSTKEVGYDVAHFLGIKDKVCVVTDATMATMPPVKKVLESLTKAGVSYEVFDQVQVEPTDASLQVAIKFCQQRQFKAFVAVGGGSVIDTAKAANLYMCYPDNDFLDFVNAPIGKGMPIPGALKPLIAVPTTAGTGSETTGVSIFDHMPTKAKTGIRDRALKPLLGIVDPDHADHCSPELTAFCGLDVLCHSLESFTAVPYHKRSAAPKTPMLRPAYQGCNPISDIWSAYALKQCMKYLPRAVEENDPVAREQMCYASTAAGIGFGNAGVHLCHAMSYPISSNVKTYRPVSGYEKSKAIVKDAIVPHGLSVILTAPEVFKWTCASDPEKHLRAAELMGIDTTHLKADDAGLAIADKIVSLLTRWRKFVPDGLKDVGYSSKDLDMLVKGTLPQRKVLDVSPRPPKPDDIAGLLDRSMKLF